LFARFCLFSFQRTIHYVRSDICYYINSLLRCQYNILFLSTTFSNQISFVKSDICNYIEPLFLCQYNFLFLFQSPLTIKTCCQKRLPYSITLILIMQQKVFFLGKSYGFRLNKKPGDEHISWFFTGLTHPINDSSFLYLSLGAFSLALFVFSFLLFLASVHHDS